MAKSRVFVSSVIEGFKPFRAAARSGIIEAGGEPVLIEDFPSLSVSARNACLNAVDSCDIYVGIVGERGGWVAPSGKLVVEEEYERARLKKLPTLFFLQETPRDADGERLAQRFSDYLAGSFRQKFRTPEELQREVVRALNPQMVSEVMVPEPPEALLSAFKEVSRNTYGDPILRACFAPERIEEIIDPVRIGTEDFARLLLEIGHKNEIGLFDYGHAKKWNLKGEILTIEEEDTAGGYGGKPSIKLDLSEQGILVSDIVLGQRGRSRDSLASGTVLAIEEIERALHRVTASYAAVIDSLDPYQRHQRFFCNMGLLGLGYRTLERNPKPRTSYTMSMRDRDFIVAFDKARIVSREDLHKPGSEIERAITLLTRRASAQ